jgi:hypothetical protein
MDAETLAKVHLNCALQLTNRDFLVAWLAETTTNTTTTTPMQRRGRKPGAPVSEAERCAWKHKNGDQCKNRHIESEAYCKIHAVKAHLIDGGGAGGGGEC